MSISTAMLAGTSGLRANSAALAAISDNIANSNTVGYKRTRNEFSSFLRDQNVYSSYNAGGVSLDTRQLLSEQGTITGSSVGTHMALSGEGFFVTRGQGEGSATNDPYYYTRAGHFTTDSEGFLVNSAGYYLHGWPIQDNATVDNTNSNDLGNLVPVKISNIGGAAEATSRVTLSANLQASQAVSPLAAGYDLAANPAASMASGAFPPDFQTTVQVYNSLGGVHTLALSFLKADGAPNTWNVEAHIAPASDMQAGGRPDGIVASGTVSFTPFGQFDAAASTFPSQLTIGASSSVAAPGTAAWATNSGLAAQTISLDIGGPSSPGGLTQYDTTSSLNSTTIDGRAYGALSNVQVDKDGFVSALFSNGLSRQIYQIPVATFANPGGLLASPGDAYLAGNESGPVALKSAGTAGAGSVEPAALEASTVDLSVEFSNLIITQRAYSASSKIITTADEMLDELIRIKR